MELNENERSSHPYCIVGYNVSCWVFHTEDSHTVLCSRSYSDLYNCLDCLLNKNYKHLAVLIKTILVSRALHMWTYSGKKRRPALFNTHLVNPDTLKLFIEGPCKGHWCGSWSNKAQLLWSHLLQLSNRWFFWLLTALFIRRNSSGLVWRFWWLLWNRKAVSGECVSPHARRVYKCLITNFSPATMDVLLVKIYTGNNQLISTGLYVVPTQDSTIRIFLLVKMAQYFRVSLTLRQKLQILPFLVTHF